MCIFVVLPRMPVYSLSDLVFEVLLAVRVRHRLQASGIPKDFDGVAGLVLPPGTFDDVWQQLVHR